MKKLNALMIAITTSLFMIGCQNTTPINQQHSSKQAQIMTDANIQKNVETVDNITPSQLASYDWRLVSAVDKSNQQLPLINALKKYKTVATLSVTPSTLHPSVGCNQIAVPYTLTNNVMTVSANAPSTLMGCGELQTAEDQLKSLVISDSQLVLKMSSKASNGREQTPILTQITKNGDTLVWEGKQTYEAKYNQQGETIFWAVHHQGKPCANGATKTCLQVKPITYNQQGIKTAEGDWVLFDGDIEGYTHDGRHDQVLRLKRFTVNKDNVKGKQYAYVLDMVVESALVD